MNYLVIPQQKNPCPYENGFDNFGRHCIGYIFYILNMLDQCSEVK